MSESQPRIYLDNAATSWPKPAPVTAARERYLREGGAAAGRGVYREALAASQQVADARHQVARLIHAPQNERIVFGHNGTDALNLAIHGLLRSGDHVVTTMAEHNSVLRPLRFLETRRQIEVTRVACDETGRVDIDDLAAALRPTTRLVVLTHASNVTGALQPIEQAAELTRSRQVLLLIDAAQTLGHVPIDVQRTPIDLLAAPGHKALLGPLGTGLLYVAPGVEEQLESHRQGGTGSQSQSDEQPHELPDKYESGNLNVAGLTGLAAGAAWIAGQTVAALRAQQVELTERMLAALRRIGAVAIHGPRRGEDRVGVISFTMHPWDPQELAAILDAPYGVCVRAGLHCAPRIHQRLGTLAGGGTVRISFGPFNTLDDVDYFGECLARVSAGA